MPLPEGFRWRYYNGYHNLWLAEYEVAYFVKVTRSYRIQTHGSRSIMDMRIHFLPTANRSRLYVEAWATKWEVRIRRAWLEGWGGGVEPPPNTQLARTPDSSAVFKGRSGAS